MNFKKELLNDFYNSCKNSELAEIRYFHSRIQTHGFQINHTEAVKLLSGNIKLNCFEKQTLARMIGY